MRPTAHSGHAWRGAHGTLRRAFHYGRNTRAEVLRRLLPPLEQLDRYRFLLDFERRLLWRRRERRAVRVRGYGRSGARVAADSSSAICEEGCRGREWLARGGRRHGLRVVARGARVVDLRPLLWLVACRRRGRETDCVAQQCLELRPSRASEELHVRLCGAGVLGEVGQRLS